MARYRPKVYEARDDREFGALACDVILSKISLSGDDRVVLPTGETPKPIWEAMRRRRPQFVFQQLDEHCGIENPQDERLFSNQLGRAVLDPAGIDLRATFDSAGNPFVECRDMATVLKDDPVRVAVLGLGLNGHIGFNEPGSAFDSSVRVVDLTPETLAQNNAYNGRGGLSGRAFTLGIGDLRGAAETVLLVRGGAKAGILARSFHGALTPDVPASYLQNQKNVTIVADSHALMEWGRG